MIKVLIPSSKEYPFYRKECKKMYIKVQEKITDKNCFEFIEKHTYYYCFIDKKGLIGVAYYFIDDGKIFINGFSKRKRYPKNVECIKLSLSWFKPPIYAEIQNRASALCLLKAGFQKFRPNLMIYEKKYTV